MLFKCNVTIQIYSMVKQLKWFFYRIYFKKHLLKNKVMIKNAKRITIIVVTFSCVGFLVFNNWLILISTILTWSGLSTLHHVSHLTFIKYLLLCGIGNWWCSDKAQHGISLVWWWQSSVDGKGCACMIIIPTL